MHPGPRSADRRGKRRAAKLTPRASPRSPSCAVPRNCRWKTSSPSIAASPMPSPRRRGSARELTDNSLSINLNSCYVHNSRFPSAMNTPAPCCDANAHERPSALEPIPARSSGMGSDGGWNVAEESRARRKNLEVDTLGFFPL